MHHESRVGIFCTEYDHFMSDRTFFEAVAQLAYANPFLPQRIEWEKAALGEDFVEDEPIWSASVADPERVRPNVWRIQEKLGPALERQRAKLQRSERDWGLYEECVHFWLYQRYYEGFAQCAIQGSTQGAGSFLFYADFLKDWNYWFQISGKNYSTALSCEHFFACCYQLARAFHGIFDHVMGSSMPAARLRASIWESIFTWDLRRYRQSLYRKMGDFPTLITGPSGTGKELVARAIAGARYLEFSASSRKFEEAKGGNFFAVNLAALSAGLIESELFGHKKGAYTGAISDRVGWLESCPRVGSVFLDELGEMDLTVQVKLLRVLETREFAAVGDTAVRRFGGKLMAATNRDLAAGIAAGRFREDLYFRLCADQIRTPGLADQIAAEPGVLAELVRYMARRAGAEEAFPAVWEWMETSLPKGYAWPGNYRELEQCVRNVLIRGSYRPLEVLRAGDPALGRVERGEMTAEELLRWYAGRVHQEAGSFVETARRLGVDRRTVRGWLGDGGGAD